MAGCYYGTSWYIAFVANTFVVISLSGFGVLFRMSWLLGAGGVLIKWYVE